MWLAALVLAKALAVVVVLVLVAQLAYPRDWALPNSRIGGMEVGYRSEAKIVADIAALQGRPMAIVSGDQELKYTPGDLGINLDGAKDAEAVTAYSWSERLVPFSLLTEERSVPTYSFRVDESKAKKFAASLKKYDQPPVNAALVLEGDDLTVVKQQDGYVYDTGQLLAEIKAAKLTSALSVTLMPKVELPAVTDVMVAEAGSRLQQRLRQPLVVEADGKTVSASADVLGSWAVITQAADKKFRIGYDREKAKQWLSGLAGQVYAAAIPRTVTIADGEQSQETEGKDGHALDVDATADAVIAAANEGRPEASGKMKAVKAATSTVRVYSRSSKGLNALLQYWDQSNAGTWGIVLKSFDGSVDANFNPDRQFTSASVYKLYVAYVVYGKVSDGTLAMDTATGNGNDVAGCLHIMIVRSDNACAIALGDMVGWDASNGTLQAKGLNSTSMAKGNQLTTPRDAASYLLQLQNGTLMAGGHRDALLDKMSHNIYRYAIPAGSAGGSANKLGAAGAFNHDVAIVYHPRGAYVLSVFSQGSNHYRIRDLAREISNVMSQ